MEHFKFLICLAFFVVISGCDAKFEEINQRIDGLEDRIEYLEELCARINTNIVSLQTLVNAVQGNDYITSIVPIVAGEDTIGYIITFTKSGPVTIYNGKDGKDGNDGADGLPGNDGKDGYTPQIGVKLDEDGIYYWTLDGDWLLDDAGNKIPVQGADGTDGKDGEDGQPGTDGQDGVTPQLKIEEGYWYISYDDGLTWTQLGKATGEDGQDGDSLFESVTEEDGYVYFVLSSGETIIVPKAQKLEIVFEETEEIGSLPGQTLRLSYTLTGADPETVIECIPKGTWEAEVEITDYASGCVAVTAPNPMTDGKVVVLANNSAGFSDMKILTFTEGTLTVADDSYELDGNASVLEIEVTTNLDYTVHIPEDAASWLSIAPATKSTMRTEILSLSVQEYPVGISRSAVVELRYGDRTLQSVLIEQTGLVHPSSSIEFEDAVVKDWLVASTSPLIDINGDGEISYEEAEQCVSLPRTPENLLSFSEFQYFVKLTEIPDDMFRYCEKMYKISLPVNISCIGAYGFYQCRSLTEIYLPRSVHKIQECAFSDCVALKIVSMPYGVEIIVDNAFQVCTSLSEITLPESLSEMGESVFFGCANLETVRFLSAIPPEMPSEPKGDEMFTNCDNLKRIVVPVGSLEAYRAVPALAPYVDLIVEE